MACYGATQVHWQFWAAATRPPDLELPCSSQLLMMGVFEWKLVEQAASSHQREVLCAIGSNAIPLGK